MLISFKVTGKNQLRPGEESVGDAPVLSHCFLLRNIWKKNYQCAGALSWRERTTVDLSFWGGTFLSDSIPKTTMNMNANFFIHISTSGKLYQRISLNCAKEFREFFKLISRYATRCITYSHMFCPCSAFICCSQYHVKSDYFATQYSSTAFSIAE
jgi:hypothetical protein